MLVPVPHVTTLSLSAAQFVVHVTNIYRGHSAAPDYLPDVLPVLCDMFSGRLRNFWWGLRNVKGVDMFSGGVDVASFNA